MGLDDELEAFKKHLDKADAYDLKAQGDRLKAVREALNMSQEEISQQLSISRSYWANVERGKRDVSKSLIDKLIGFFNASVLFIYFGYGEPIGNYPPAKKNQVVIDLALQDYYKELDRLYTCILSVVDLRIKHLGDDKEYSPYLAKLTHQVSRYADNVSSIELKKALFENYPALKEAFIKDFLELFENYHFDVSQSSTLVRRKFVAPKNVIEINP